MTRQPVIKFNRLRVPWCDECEAAPATMALDVSFRIEDSKGLIPYRTHHLELCLDCFRVLRSLAQLAPERFRTHAAELSDPQRPRRTS